MPLRSVEAASRDDAIAAAREQFGPAARVVGVRRVRSGGVLGFFATERYVAEVAPEPAGVPGVPVAAPARPAGALTEDPDTGSLAAYGSPLAGAAPARARTAPPRNGAAAWAAAAARSGAAAPRATPALVGASAGPARRTDAAPRRPEPADDARVEELAGLLGAPVAPAAQRTVAPAAEPVSRFGVAPASFPRTTRTPAPAVPAEDVPAEPASGSPSPFTAALARMVAGDRDVQHAVRAALETSDAARPGDAHSRPGAALPEAEFTSESSVRSGSTRQEEETVGDQVIAPPSPSVDERAEFAAWADEDPFSVGSFASESLLAESFPSEPAFAEPSFAVEPVVVEPPAAVDPPVAIALPVSREEAIAEVLRAALAEGHSDDALAGILRKFVAGDSPQDVLAEPVVPQAPAEAPVEEPPAVEVLAELPVVEEAVVEEAVVEAPVAQPVAAPEVSRFDLFSPVVPSPSAAPAAPAGTSSPVELWGAVPVPVPARTEAPATTTTPSIWAELTPASAPATPAPRAETALFEAPLVVAPATGTPVETPLFETSLFETSLFAVVPDAPAVATPPAEPADAEVAEPVGAEAAAPESAVVESSEEVPVDEVLVEAVHSALDLDITPALARTASDPAPVGRSMAMDATSVMPPLSLLPGSSRGRGLPPVPPRSGRPAVPQSRGGAVSSSSASASSSRTSELLATVTRLPVTPLTATPETPELADLADFIEADASGLLDSPVLPAAVPARPTRVRIDPPRTPAEVVSRLADLGVPADLLGASFTADVEARGTYAALTGALGDRLPEAPEFPTGAGDVLFVVGPGVETLRAARSLATTMRLDADRVQWATRGDLVGLAPETSRMSTVDAALRRRHDASSTGTVTIVAVDAPLRTDAYWMAQMLAIWSPVAVWAVVESTRKPEDLEHWLDGLARVDALIVQDTDLSAGPAAVLDRLAVPVAVVDGVRATPHRWASVLCERLESAPA